MQRTTSLEPLNSPRLAVPLPFGLRACLAMRPNHRFACSCVASTVANLTSSTSDALRLYERLTLSALSSISRLVDLRLQSLVAVEHDTLLLTYAQALFLPLLSWRTPPEVPHRHVRERFWWRREQDDHIYSLHLPCVPIRAKRDAQLLLCCHCSSSLLERAVACVGTPDSEPASESRTAVTPTKRDRQPKLPKDFQRIVLPLEDSQSMENNLQAGHQQRHSLMAHCRQLESRSGTCQSVTEPF